MKLETYNYPHFRVSVVVFLSYYFGLFITCTGRTSGPILTIYTSFDVFLCKDVPFGVLLICWQLTDLNVTAHVFHHYNLPFISILPF